MSKLFRAIIGAVVFVAGVVAMTIPGAQAIGLQLIIAGVSILGSTLLQPKAKPRQASETAVKLGEVPRQAIFGRAATAGSLVDAFNFGGKYGTDWEVVILALADHKCEELEGFWVNDEYVAFAGDGAVAGYGGQLEVYFREGTEAQTVPAIVTTNGPGWTANDNGAGVCWVAVAYKADDPEAKNPVWPGGRPRFLWVLKGALCYVARDDDTVTGGSGPHRWATPSTREWTENLIDCRYTWVRGLYACDRVGDPDMLLIGRGLSEVEAPPAATFAPANLCGELVGGSPRYRCGGMVYADEKYLDVEEKFAAACAGVIVQRDGAVEIEPGQAKTPVASITDADFLTGSAREWDEFPSEADRSWVNTVIPRYFEPAQKWADHGAPIRRVIADVIADGGPREETLSLQMVNDGAQAGRVGEIARRLGRIWGRGGGTLGPRFAHLEEGDWISWTSARHFGGATRTFRIESYQLDKKWHNKIQLREIAASAYAEGDVIADESATDAGAAPGDIGAPDPLNWTLAAELLDGGAAGAVPAIVIAGDSSDDPAAGQIKFEYWPDDGVTDPADVTDWNLAALGGQGTKRVEITSIVPGADYYAAVTYLVSGIPGDRLILGPVTAGELGGLDGADGHLIRHVWKRAASAPATPTGNGIPTGWEAAPPAGSDPLWLSVAEQEADGTLVGTWSAPIRLDGAAGAAGLSSALVFIFQRSASVPTLPSATTTYTFATGVLTGLDNGWTQTVPAGSNPLYVSVATAAGSGASDTIASGEWASPVIQAQDGAAGAAGLNSASVFLFQRTASASAPSLPGSTLTYTFATGVLSGTLGSWSQSVPASGGAYLWVTTAAAIATGSTDTIATEEWATARLLAQDGTAGAAGASGALVFIFQRAASAPTLPSATTTYTFATGVLTGLNNGWTQVPPAGSNPLYVAVATATGSGASDTIAAGEWASPVILAENGAPGAAGLSAASVFLFQRTATSSAPALPSTTATYTFATGVLTGHNNGWTQSLPATGDSYRWMTTATAAATGASDTIGAGEWAAASLIAQDGAAGAAGLNNATVFLYQRAASPPSVPGSTLTYTFATGVLSGTLGSWSQQVPAGANPLYVTAATASANTASDTIATGEWASPVIQAEHGEDGAAGLNSASVFLYQRNVTGIAPAAPGSTLTYTFATGVLSGTLGSWSQTIPDEANGGFLFATTAVAIATGTTDNIASGEWAAVRLIAQDGFDLGGNELFDAMLYADATQLNRGWETKSGSGEISQVTDADASGAVAMEVGNSAGNDSLVLLHRNMLPYDATALWMIAFEAEAVAGSPNLYAGVAGRATDRTTLVNTSGANTWDQQHLMAASAAALPAAYQSYIGFFTGRAGSGFSFPNQDPLNPSKLHTNVAFVSPQMLLNYPSATAKTGVREVRLKKLDRVPTWRNGGTASILRSDSWAKQDGASDWAGVWFTPIGSTKGCSVAAIVPTSGTEWEIGLTTEAPPSAAVQTAWAARGNGDGNIDIYENGSLAHDNVTTVAAGDRIEVSYDQVRVTVRKNGTIIGTPETVALSGEVKGKVRLGAGSVLTNLEFERGGAGGTDGESGYTITPPQIVYIGVTANYVPKDGELPQSVTFSVRRGATDLSDDASVDYVWSNPAGVTASMGGTNGKVWTVTAMASNAAVTGTVTITHDSVTIAVVDITTRKVRDGQGSSPLFDDTLTINNTASYTGSPQGGAITRTCGPGTIAVDLTHPYEAAGSSGKLAGTLYYRTTPGSGGWTALGAEEQDALGALPSEPSVLTFQRTVAGPSTPANWEFKYENRRYEGSGTLSNMTGGSPLFAISGEGT